MCVNTVEEGEQPDCGCSSAINRPASLQSSNKGVEEKEEEGLKLEGDLPTKDMVLIPSGVYTMGDNKRILAQDGEGPARRVTITSFYMDRYEVSNADYALFTRDTGYVTETEEFGNSFVVDYFLSPEVSSGLRK